MSKKTKPEAEEQEQVKTEAPAEETAKADAKPATDWEAKYNDLNDRYLRMAAEYDNFRKRSQREREQAYLQDTLAVLKQHPNVVVLGEDMAGERAAVFSVLIKHHGWAREE